MNEEQRQRFEAELKAAGVGVVKERIATNYYSDPWKTVAQGWVERKEASSSAEQLTLARQANTIAIAAVFIAAFSMIIAAISLIVAVFK